MLVRLGSSSPAPKPPPPVLPLLLPSSISVGLECMTLIDARPVGEGSSSSAMLCARSAVAPAAVFRSRDDWGLFCATGRPSGGTGSPPPPPPTVPELDVDRCRLRSKPADARAIGPDCPPPGTWEAEG